MAKANQGINFDRLFAVKDQLAAKPGPQPDPRDSTKGEGTPQNEVVDASRSADALADVLEFPAAVQPTQSTHASEFQRASEEGASRVIREVPGAEAEQAAARLRIWMPRALHHRVRMAAAMATVQPTVFVRELLEHAVPPIDTTLPLAELSRGASTLAPVSEFPRRGATEVRMQILVTANFHTRLVQVAALRGQTLGSCMLDLLELRLPR